MEISQLKMILEGALLAAGRPLDIKQIEKLFNQEEVSSEWSGSKVFDSKEDNQRPLLVDIHIALEEIRLSCNGRGFQLKQTASGYRFQVREELSFWVNRLWEEKPKKYSRAFLETLSLIVYKQPVTRGEIEEVRGVSVSSDTIRSLLERDWIKVVGHKDVPGQPALYATTSFFLDYFDLKNLKDLPVLNEIKNIREMNTGLALDVLLQTEKASSDIIQNESAVKDIGDNNQITDSPLEP
jgi:segregation and condensation protein B|tara:strand:+ start:1617 stop:2333 length:717 start_codon:yes stop_codon:yes gene_type:complete